MCDDSVRRMLLFKLLCLFVEHLVSKNDKKV